MNWISADSYGQWEGLNQGQNAQAAQNYWNSLASMRANQQLAQQQDAQRASALMEALKLKSILDNQKMQMAENQRQWNWTRQLNDQSQQQAAWLRNFQDQSLNRQFPAGGREEDRFSRWQNLLRDVSSGAVPASSAVTAWNLTGPEKESILAAGQELEGQRNQLGSQVQWLADAKNKLAELTTPAATEAAKKLEPRWGGLRGDKEAWDAHNTQLKNLQNAIAIAEKTKELNNYLTQDIGTGRWSANLPFRYSPQQANPTNQSPAWLSTVTNAEPASGSYAPIPGIPMNVPMETGRIPSWATNEPLPGVGSKIIIPVNSVEEARNLPGKNPTFRTPDGRVITRSY